MHLWHEALVVPLMKDSLFKDTHTHNLLTPGGRAERATKAGLLLHCLCYIAASLAPVSSLTPSFMPLVVQVKALACHLGRSFSVPCLSLRACGLVLRVAD